MRRDGHERDEPRGGGWKRPDAAPLEVVAVSLDVTGTLIHSPRLAELYSEVLERHGVSIPAERLRELIPLVWQELSCRVEGGRDRFGLHPDGERGWWSDYLGRVCEYEAVAHPGPFAAAELYERFARADAWAIYDDVEATLAELGRRGFRLMLTSNWDRRLPRLLERLGLLARFEELIYSAEVGFEKPHRAVFEALLAALDLAPSEVVHVGDRRLDDVEGPAALGIPGMHLDRRRGRGDLAGLDELPDVLSYRQS
jgi:putative hydrolase of the HAD superfamily